MAGIFVVSGHHPAAPQPKTFLLFLLQPPKAFLQLLQRDRDLRQRSPDTKGSRFQVNAPSLSYPQNTSIPYEILKPLTRSELRQFTLARLVPGTYHGSKGNFFPSVLHTKLLVCTSKTTEY